ncbi:MAG: MFS transporter [Pyrinomonadaceae bacterium]|nr:MFS transporter [Pyrinomonadaceae bacterium]
MSVELEAQTQEPQEHEEPHATGMFRALSHRNFRLFWTGAFLSNVGTWMQAVAQGWLVLQLTDSPFWLGVDGFMATAPGLALTLLAGVFADLVDRRRLLIFTQIGAGLSALTLAILIRTHVVNNSVDIWIVLLLSFVTGCCFAVAGPSYQAITIDLVDREDLANAIALNSTQFQLSRVVGPVFAGLGFKLFGLAGCFFANALSFVAVIVSLRMIRFEDGKGTLPLPSHSARDSRAVWQDLKEGLRYVRGRPRVFMLLIISGLTSLFGAPYMSLVPVFARDILHVGETGLALMSGMSGAGALLGALVLAFLGNFKHKGWSVLGGAFAFSIFLIGFALSTRLMMSLTFIFGMGFAIVSCVAVINMLLQQLVTDEMRGRVMSMFILSFVGTMPIGNLIAGSVAARFGAPYTLAGGGVIIAFFIAIIALANKRLREL